MSRRWVIVTVVLSVTNPEKMDRLLKGPFTDRQGNFNYREWVKVLRVNDAEGT